MNLLRELAPKYAKDHKILEDAAALKAMCEVICGSGPSITGTTVSINV